MTSPNLYLFINRSDDRVCLIVQRPANAESRGSELIAQGNVQDLEKKEAAARDTVSYTRQLQSI